MSEPQVKADVQRFLDDAMADDPDLEVALDWNLMVPATEIDAEDPVVEALLQASRLVLDREPRLDAFPGATDAAYIHRLAGVPCVASFGPGFLPRAHSPNESLHTSGPATAAMVYAMAALDYLETAADAARTGVSSSS